VSVLEGGAYRLEGDVEGRSFYGVSILCSLKESPLTADLNINVGKYI
jgi:hypothetical protein